MIQKSGSVILMVKTFGERLLYQRNSLSSDFQTPRSWLKNSPVPHFVNPLLSDETFFLVFHVFFYISAGSRDGPVVRALTSHQCGPGSIPELGVICGLSLLLVLVLAPRGFSPGTLKSPERDELIKYVFYFYLSSPTMDFSPVVQGNQRSFPRHLRSSSCHLVF